MSSIRCLVFAIVACAILAAAIHAQESTATLRIHVEHENEPVADASDAEGNVVVTVAAGRVEILVVKDGFAQVRTSLVLVAGRGQDVDVELSDEFEETVTMSVTRTNTRLEDQPMRVEVVPGEEVLSATFDLLKQIGPARIGFEVFYTGRQALEDNGGLVDWAVGRSRVYVDVENLGDVRKTRENPFVMPVRGVDGRWTVDAWAPLEGRTLNADVRWRF